MKLIRGSRIVSLLLVALFCISVLPAVTVQRLPGISTYTAATTLKTATAAGTGPFFSICGSSTKTVRVQRVFVQGQCATAAVNADLQLRKTSTATSAGTAVTLTAVPHDSTAASATVGLVNYYTALATTGTNVGMVGAHVVFLPVAPALGSSDVFDFTTPGWAEGVVLRGTAQCLEASFGTTTTNAPTLSVMVTWTEE